jgi:hypothetical protein
MGPQQRNSFTKVQFVGFVRRDVMVVGGPSVKRVRLSEGFAACGMAPPTDLERLTEVLVGTVG